MRSLFKGICIGFIITCFGFGLLSFIQNEDEPRFYLETGKVSSLYKGVSNKLMVRTPGIKKIPVLSYVVKGAKLVEGEKAGEITLIPKENEVSLNILNKGKSLGEIELSTRPIPVPLLELTANGKKVTSSQRKNGLMFVKTLGFNLVTDSQFMDVVPDVKYLVKDWSVILARGKVPVSGGQMEFEGNRGNVRKIMEKVQSGDRLIIQVKSVVLLSDSGQLIPVDMPLHIEAIPFGF